MNKPVSQLKPQAVTDSQGKNRKLRKNAVKKTVGKPPVKDLRLVAFYLALEMIAFLTMGIYSIILVLGKTANWFSGTSFLGSLLPFAMGVLILLIGSVAVLLLWWRFRRLLLSHSSVLPPLAAIGLAVILFSAFGQDSFYRSFTYFRTLVGGKEEASRVTLKHQVFAAYRRYHSANLLKLVQRAAPFNQAISEAANEFDIDLHLLQGIAAAESSFLPRESSDGGHGLFQITAVPQVVVNEAKNRLRVEQLSLYDPKHNAYIAAATFKHYLAEMKNDVFLGLLAYNIGPANGGLRFIMKKYGVTDFITIQPYLQLLPRDYPIRVLSYALAFRLWQKQGKLLAYEEGNNAVLIQRWGVPGLP